MKILYSLKALFLIPFIFAGNALFASHYMGVDITYICNPTGTNPCIYRIYHKAYFDCSTYAPPNSVDPFPAVNFTGVGVGCTGPTAVGPAVQVFVGEVTPICPNIQTKCTNPSATLSGVSEVFYYQDFNFCTVTCAIYNISWTTCCRNYAITSLTGAGISIYTSNTSINLSSNCNSSPIFNNKPVPYICLNQPFTFNQGASDPDGDSISYSLIPCYDGPLASDSVPYAPGYSSVKPLGATSTTTINPVTGDITILVSSLQVGVLCVQVTEWRNGVAIGTVVRDIQITVINCGLNNAPTVSGMNAAPGGPITTFIDTFCSGTPICFNISPFDTNAGQIVTMYWNQNIPTATFTSVPAGQTDTITGTNIVGQFCWTPTAADVGLNSFLLTVKDNNCPVLGTNQYTFQIFINSDIAISASAVNDSCNIIDFTGIPGGGVGPFNFTWNGTGNLNINPNNTDSAFSHYYPAPGTYPYTLTITDANGCIGTLADSITIGGATANAGSDLSICAGNTAGITLGSPALPGHTYSWNPPAGLSSTTVAQPSLSSSLPPGSYFYVLTAISGVCTTFDFVDVFINPIPTVSVSGDTTICPGDSITLYASGGSSYFWSPGGQTADSIRVAPTTNSSYSVTSFAGGCVSAPATVNISMNTGPTLASSPDVSICVGQATTINAAASAGTGPLQYQWSPLVNMTPSGGNTSSVSVNPGVTQMYYVTVTDACGLTQQDSVLVTVNQLPAANFSIAKDTACIGQPVAIDYLGSAPFSATYQWDFAGGVVVSGTGQGPYVINWFSGGTHTVSLIVTENGCPSTLFSRDIYIHPSISSIETPDTVICYGQSVPLTVVGAGGNGGPYSYTWTPGTGLNTTTGGNVIANPLSTVQYTISVSDGCSPDNTNTITVSVLPELMATTGGDKTICLGEFAQLEVFPSGGTGGPYFYMWTPAAGLSATNIANPLASPTQTTTYSVLVSDGCSNDKTVQITVKVEDPPNPPEAFSDVICANETAVLQAISPGNTIYWYYAPTGGTPFHTGNVYNHPPAAHTLTYWLEAENYLGCRSLTRSRIDLIVNVNPSFEFTATPPFTEIPEAIVTFNFIPTNANPIHSFFWEFGDGMTSQLRDPVHQYTTAGKYFVSLTVVDTYGCKHKVTYPDFVEVTQFINIIAPNAFTPNGDGINEYFSVSHRLINSFQISVFDRWGNMIFTSQDPNFMWDGTNNGSAVPEGTYIYTITGNAIDNTPIRLNGSVTVLH